MTGSRSTWSISRQSSSGMPLSLYTYDDNLRNQINSALYVASAGGNISAPGELSYEYANGDISVRKSFVFGETYVISIETEVTQQRPDRFRRIPCGRRRWAMKPLAPPTRRKKSSTWPMARSSALRPRRSAAAIRLRGPFNWAGPQDQFFAAMFLPDNPDTAAMVTLHDSITVPKDPKNPDPNNVVNYEVLGAAVGDNSGVTSERLFVGPKALNVLESVRSNTAPGQMNGPDLRDVVDFGFFHADRAPAVPVAEVDARAHGPAIGAWRSSS